MKKTKNKIFYISLFIYHLIFTVISYTYLINNGGDSNLYWFQTPKTLNKDWSDFLYAGTDFVCLINYPLVKFLNLPLWFGYALYSFIGYLAILQFVKWLRLMIPTQIVYKNFNLVMLIAFLPSLHYWTTLLGKEPLILLGITTFVLEISKAKGNLFQIIGALLLVALVRPHIAILLILCFVTIYILFKKNTLKTKILVIFSSLLIFILSGVALLKISKIHKLDVAKTLRYNEFSKLSKSDSNSYVPMNEYSLPEEVFTFYFRPLFLDSKSVLYFFASIENLIILLLHVVSLCFLILYRKKIKLNYMYWSLILYYLVFALVYIQRYSILGLIVRTKIMSQPFFLVFLLYILVEVYKLKENNNKVV
jgi:hypothetical protein